MFVHPDNRLLVMNTNDGRTLTADEMRMLVDAGLDTIYMQGAIYWDRMQPSPGAPLDWRNPDEQVEAARQAGAKILMPFCYSLPAWKPDNWFHSREIIATSYGIASYTNPDVAAELDAFALEVIERYKGDDFQLIFSLPCNNEFPFTMWPTTPLSPIPVEDLAQWVVDRQRIYEAQYNEVWTAYHPYTNPVYWDAVYGALFSFYPFARHYGITFTYVQHNHLHIKPLIKRNQDKGMIYYGGAEYVQGMRVNYDKLRSNGMRMLVAPKHPFQPVDKITPDLIEEMLSVLDLYNDQA